MIDKMQIYTEAKSILIGASFIDLSNTPITKNTDFYNDLGMDSLDKIEVLMTIEKHFKISISNADAENISNLSDICTCVQKELMKNQETKRILTKKELMKENEKKRILAKTVKTKKSFLQNLFSKTK